MASPLIVSCLFGPGPFDLHLAPDGEKYECLFFTNREDVAARAVQRGWRPVLLPWPVLNDSVASALQAKWVKFLCFLDDPDQTEFRDRAVAEGVLYFDHKFSARSKHISQITTRANGADILIRSTPRLKSSVWDEVNAAQNQERYMRNMAQTLSYVDEYLERGISPETRVCNTGLIFYADVEKAVLLTQSVYEACTTIGQPECQIFWALHAQDFEGDICVVDWNDPAVADIAWQNPLRRRRRNPLRLLKAVLRRIRLALP
mgnify:CR=1 FL=1